MSTNVYAALKALLPPAPVLVGLVVSINSDDTSTIQLPLGLGTSSYGPGVAAGSLLRARGTSVPVGSNAFVRDGVVESQAPDGTLLDISVGTLRENPLGPTGLTLASNVPDLNLTAGVAAEYDLTAHFSGYYIPLAFVLAAGDLLGMALDPDTGVISGTPTAGSTTAQVTVGDSTGLQATTNTFAVVAA